MRLRTKNKTGSHVGVVLSFVIFITFIFFLYIITQPRLGIEDRESVLNQLEANIKARTSSQLTTASVSVSSSGSDCVELVNFLSITGISNKVKARSGSGSVLDVDVSGNNLRVRRNDNTFFRIYNSEEFPQETGSLNGCQVLNEGSYTLGLVRTTDEVFETKILKLILDYNSDYDALKEELEVALNEFGFDFIYSNGTTIQTTYPGTLPSNLNIYANPVSVQYINTDAETETGTFNIRAW